MFKALSLSLLSLTFVSSCQKAVDVSMISASPASSEQFAMAQQAARVCAQHGSDKEAQLAGFQNQGFAKSTDSRLSAIAKNQKSHILEKSGSDVVVQIGARGGEAACIIGLKGMTPQQSFALAQPWVKKYGALTNQERGQGLANDVVQAWGKLEDERIVYIAAYKTWDVLDVPGAAARHLYINRKR